MIPITLSQFYFSNPNLINLLGIFFNILNMIYIKLCNNMVIAFAFEVYSIMYHFPRQGVLRKWYINMYGFRRSIMYHFISSFHVLKLDAIVNV